MSIAVRVLSLDVDQIGSDRGQAPGKRLCNDIGQLGPLLDGHGCVVDDMDGAVLRGDHAGGGHRPEHRRNLARRSAGLGDQDDANAVTYDFEGARLEDEELIGADAFLDQSLAFARRSSGRSLHMASTSFIDTAPPTIGSISSPSVFETRSVHLFPKMTIVVLPVSGIEPPLLPDATATYCLPFCS